MRLKLFTMLAVMVVGSAQAGLVHSYDFSSGVTDLTGTENATLVGGATVGGGVLSVDGVSGYAQFGSHIIPTTGSYSVVLDFRLAGAQSGIHELISQGASGGPGFYIGSSNSSDFRVTDSWGNSGIAFPTDTRWHQAALIVDATGNRTEFYLDGSFAGSLGQAITTTALGSDTRLGVQFNSSGEYFAGDIDNVRIYDSAIGSNQLADAPEPSSALLVALGAGLVAVARRRKA